MRSTWSGALTVPSRGHPSLSAALYMVWEGQGHFGTGGGTAMPLRVALRPPVKQGMSHRFCLGTTPPPPPLGLSPASSFCRPGLWPLEVGGASAPTPGVEGSEAQGGQFRLRAWQVPAAHRPGQAGGAGATLQGLERGGSQGPRRAEAPVWGPRSSLQQLTPGRVPPPSWSGQESGHEDTSLPDRHHHCTEKQENSLQTTAGTARSEQL